MSETTCKFERSISFDDLESVALNIEAIPSMVPRLDRIGVSKPQKNRINNNVSVVEVGFRHFRKGQLDFHEYDLYE
ncbi:MAG: hypothetical protein ABR986_00320 [Methanomassiliicoccales archaeon]|jgi:hypothetical protein